MVAKWVCCLMVLALVGSASAELAGYWQLDEGAGATAADSSGKGNHGTLVGPPQWVDGFYGGALQFNAQNNYVEIPASDSLEITPEVTVAAWINWTDSGDSWLCILANGQQGGPWENYGLFVNRTSRYVYFTLSLNDTHTTQSTPNNTIAPGQWQHVSATWDGSTARIYVDGVLQFEEIKSGTLTSPRLPLRLGHRNGSVHYYSGMMDDVAVFDHALTQLEIQEAMQGIAPAQLAKDPRPEDAAVDVSRDIALGWAPGRFAATHDVYFGTSFEDVNNATQPTQSATDAAYDPEGLLEYGRTYYWRVDEVNGAPDYTVFKGETWSFTTETYAYPITSLTVMASSQQITSPATRTIDGSGLDEFDQHGTDLKTMWVTPGGLPAWIQYTFDRVYKLHELWVWNSNSELEPLMGFGAKDVAIEYSTDGENWTPLENVPQFAQGTGKPTYTANTLVDLGEVMAQYVKLTINDNWGATTMVSLSEVRFFYTPVQAFEPAPANGATGVDLGATLDWRPGREATSHEVYFGTDPNGLAAQTVADHSYTPAAMDFGTVYYWKVNEAGDAGTYEGDVWSFTSQEFAPIDDFESYNDDIDAGTTIWQTWTDGVTTKASGSQVGYTDSPFAERTIVHSGAQSMPLMYNNAGDFFFSEAEREFDPAQNWTGNGATEVCVWTRGYPAITTVAVAETSGKIDLTGAGTDIWGNSDEFTYAYKTLAGDGTLVARVVSNGTGTQTWAKGGVMIRDSLWGGSTQAMMAMTATGGNGASFQYRATANAASASADSSAVVAPPYWVKIERAADTFKGSVSADGKTWTQIGTTVIAMTDPVYIGLCVTSHEAGVDRTYQFDSIVGTGTITGAWQGAVIDSPQYNDAADMHLLLSDSAGKNATVTSATAVTTADWTRWVIPMSDFAGVNFAKVKKMVITIGDKAATTAGGTGIVFIDDIGFGRSAQ
ncbi:MAG: LamG-like jellyroll fold domain-containing protein [Phycisphaerales bacterium]